MASEDKNLFVSDEPITSEDDDKFRHGEYVDSLERILRNTEPPWHIGIFGEWGSGKTSIIKLLYNRIEENSDFDNTVCVEFDAWSHAEGSIRTELLLELDRKIGEEIGRENGVLGEDEITSRLYDVEEEEESVSPSGKERIIEFVSQNPFLVASFLGIGLAAGAAAHLGRMNIASVIATGLLLPVFGYIIKQFDTVTQTVQRRYMHPRKEWSGAYERIFDLIIQESDAEKVIISIDNLDRCESSTVLDVLVTLKTYMEHENCIYLIPCDDNALESHIHSIDEGGYFEDEEHEREFLRKFFQTSIRVPPFLPEDIEDYAFSENQKLSEPFDDETIDVITNAYIDNPRRIKHAINRLATQRVLAEEIEGEGSINEGRITDTMPFLAKVSILEENHPEFFDAISTDHYLWEDVNKYFNNELDDKDRIERVEELVSTDDSGVKSRLEIFLRSTRRVTVDNPQPFFNLSEPSYATSVNNMDSFLRDLRAGKEDEIQDELEQVQAQDESFQPYHDAIQQTLDNYSHANREQPLFSTLNTLVNTFDSVEPDSQEELAETIGEHLNTESGIKNLKYFDVSSCFPVILKMSGRDRRDLLNSYAELTVENNKLQSNRLNGFINHANDIPRATAGRLMQNLKSLGGGELKAAVNLLDTDKEAKDELVNPGFIREVIHLIDLQNNQYSDTEYYRCFDKNASKSVRSDYVEHLLNLREDHNGNPGQMNQELADQLMDIEPEITGSTAKELVEKLQEYAPANGKRESIEIVEVGFYHFDSFNQSTEEEFRDWVGEIFQNWNPNNVRQVYELYDEYDVTPLDSKEEVQGLMKRIPGHINDNSFITDEIVPAVPDHSVEHLSNKVRNLIRNNNTSHSQLGLRIFREYADKLEDYWNELLEQCDNQAQRENNVNRKKQYFEPGAKIFGKRDGPGQQDYIDQISQQLIENTQGYSQYKELWGEIESHADSDNKETVARNVHEELTEQMNSGQNPNNLEPLVEILQSLATHLSQDEGEQLMERLSNRFTEAGLNANQKATVIDQIAGFGSFFGKDDQILNRLDNLLDRSNHNQVQSSAEQLLNTMEERELQNERVEELQGRFFSGT